MLTACMNERPGPETAANQLADALAALDVSTVSFINADSAAANAELETAVSALNPLAPEVSVAQVQIAEENEDSATMQLQFSWDIAGAQDWTYTTTGQLARNDEDQWLSSWSPALLAPELGADEQLATRTTTADRAEILGAGGEVLVTDRPVVRIGLDKARVEAGQLDESARALAELVGLDPQNYLTRVEEAGEMAFIEAIVLRDTEDRSITEEDLQAIPGARSMADQMALAPTREFARPVLGSVGTATAELIEQSDGRLKAGDIAGLSGLQQQYDEQLRGTAGVTILAAPTAESQTPEAEPEVLFESEPTAGEALQTTINAPLQTLAEQVLAEQGDSPTSIVAIQPSTGHVLAVANGPGSQGYATSLLGQYAPGSTFKVATSLALIRQGLTPDSTVACTPTVTVDGREFENAPTYLESALGDITLARALAQSCNTAFIAAADTVSQQQLAEAAAALGIGSAATPGFALPAFFGSVPTEAQGTAHAAAMIGQGKVLVSPLALTMMAASVGAGERVAAQLVVDAADPAAATATEPTAPDPSSSNPAGAGVEAAEVTADEANLLAGMMRGVVTEGGAFMLADIAGPPVVAKTGTAEYGTEDPPRAHAWMVAIQGDLAVTVFVEDGEYGSTSGGPLMEEFLSGAAGIL